MIEMKMRGEHDVDVFGTETSLSERRVQVPAAVDAVDVVKLRIVFVADSGVDQHCPHAADDKRAHGQEDASTVVRRGLLFPERLGHDAEHGAAVQTNEPVEQRDQLELADAITPNLAVDTLLTN
jgi:hypothetical protein